MNSFIVLQINKDTQQAAEAQLPDVDTQVLHEVYTNIIIGDHSWDFMHILFVTYSWLNSSVTLQEPAVEAPHAVQVKVNKWRKQSVGWGELIFGSLDLITSSCSSFCSFFIWFHSFAFAQIRLNLRRRQMRRHHHLLPSRCVCRNINS